ncbi:MAG: hypothetical protein KKH44_08415, partial [Bacteroidetes bacterium]|nr:hypothetical protein [Bacteroidota bacterium]
MSAININKKLHGAITPVISAANTTAATLDDLTAVSCDGYNRLLVQYTVTTGWDRAGTITIYNSLESDGTYIAADYTVSNITHNVSTTDTGGNYIVENHLPYIKVAWTRTTTGTTGTISVSVMPFNSKTLRKKWSGLKMEMFSEGKGLASAELFDSHVDILLA